MNIVSVQVLIYWIVAIAFIKTRWLMEINWITMLLFIVGIFLTKMGVLWLYARYSKAVLSRSDFLANNINRVIGLILIFTGIIQFLK